MSHRNRASARRSRLLRRRLTLEQLESRQMLTGDPTLVAHWTFEENAGTVAHDAAGVDHAAISGGATWAPGRIGTALKVDAATGGKAVAPDEPALRFVASQSYTLSAWVEADAYVYGWQGVVTKNRDDSNWYGIWILSGQWVAPTPSSMLMGSQVTPGWHHVALVQDGAAGTRSLYVDGVSVATGAAQDANGVGGLWVGGAGGVSEFFSGSVDDVRVYSRALSGSELTALANPPVIAPPAVPTGLSAAAAPSTAVDLAWTDKAFDESGFKVFRSADGTNFTQVGSVGASATPYQKVNFRDTGLVANRTYYYRVVATNSVGDSAATNTASVRTQLVDGLVSEWSFGEGTGTVAHDASGTNDATLLGGAVWTAAGPGVSGAVRFPAGAGGHLVVPDTAALRFGTSQSFTLSAWVSPDLTTSGWQGVVTKARDSAGWYGIWLGDYHWWVGGSDGGNLIATSATAGWHHVAIVQDGAAGTRAFYIDGVSVVSGPAREAGGLGDLWIGGAAGVGEFFTGSIGDVRIYSRALTGAELTGLTVVPSAAPTSLTATAVSGTQVNLAWADATNNEDGFLVERSTDGVNFTQVARVGPNVAAYADAGRAAGTTYTYRVRAVNVVGYSPYSPTVSATTAAAGETEGDTLAAALPVPLTLGTLYRHQATIGDGLYPNRDVDLYRVELTAGQYLAIQVEARNLDEGGALSNLDTYLRVFNSAGNQLASNDNAVNPNNGVSSADSALGFTAPTAGTYYIGVSSFASRNYAASVAGSGSAGTSGESTGDYRLQLRLFATAPPSAPASVTATSAGSGQINLAWNGLPTATGYYVERSPSGLNTWQAVATVGATPGVPASTYQDTGVAPGTYYNYRVRAFNDTGASPYSPVASAWTGPPAPTGLTMSVTSATRIVLNWTLSTGNASGYQVEQSTDGVTGWRLIWGVASDATTYQVNGSFNGATTYYFRVRATSFTGAYSSYTPILTVTTPAFPDPPTLTSAVAESDAAVALTWSDVPRETGFRVERSANGGTTWTTAGTVAAGVTTFVDSGLAEGTAYSYRVVATNSVGDSAPGSAKSATTFPTAPTGLSATPVSATRVDLAWTNRSTTAVYYTIEQSPDGATGWQRVGTVYGSAANRFSAPGPFRGASTYFFRVYANTTAGDHTTNTANGSVTTLAFPDPPALTSVAAQSDAVVALTWSDVPRETGFRVERSANGGTTWTTAGTVAAGVTTFVDSGLHESQSVSYRVVAFNAVGDSAPGEPRAVLSLPAAPTGLTATAVSAGRVDLTWTDVSAVELGYRVEQSSSPDGPWTQVASAGMNATSVSVAGAFDGSTPYYFRVRAYTATTTSLAAEASVTTGAWPQTPAQPGATAVSATRIDLAWPAVAGATSYAVERRGYNQANWVPVATVTGGATGYQDTGVSSGTTYVYRVRASNAAGGSPYSPEAVIATPALPGVPPGLSATAPGTTWINLSWGNVADETGYSVERSPNGTTGWQVVATLGANVTSYSDADLNPGTAYYYRVRATNAAGASGYSVTAAVTTLAAPAAPTNLAATAVSAYQIALSWTASTSGVSYYAVEASSDGVSGWREVGTTGANTTTFTAPGPFGGASTYYFRVLAFNPTTRYSVGSTVLAVTTPEFPAVPVIASAVAASAAAVTLTWDAVTGATGYLVERSANGGQTWLSAGTVTGTTFVDHGLQEAQSYTYRVVAYNALGDSFGSRTSAVSTPLMAPTELVATTVSADRIDLSWSDRSTAEGGYQIEMSRGADDDWLPVAEVGAGVTSYSVPGPFDGSTRYYFRVYALTTTGDISSLASIPETVSIVTDVWPETPQGLNANVVSSTRIDLSWRAVTDATGYTLERSTNGSNWTVIATSIVGNASFSDTTPPQDASLFYRVRATNSLGDSASSDIVNPVTRYHTPTVTSSAAAKPRLVNGQPDPTPNVVTGQSVDLTVRATSQEGESQLLYFWSVVSGPTDASIPDIPGNGTNAAKDVTASFYEAGIYTFRVTIKNGTASATNDVTINVLQSASSISMTPSVVRVTRTLTETTQQFSATVKDQFGQALRYQPSLSWSTSGGTVDQYGLLKVTPELVGSEVISVGCAAGNLTASATVVLPQRDSALLGIGTAESPNGLPVIAPFDGRFHDGVRLSTQDGYGIYGLSNYGDDYSTYVSSTEPDETWHSYDISYRNYPEGFGLGDLYADFVLPVNELKFDYKNVRLGFGPAGSYPVVGTTSATVRIFQNGTHTTDVSLSYGAANTYSTVDLSTYPGITRIEITNIVADGGFGIRWFSFDHMTTPGVLTAVDSGDSDRDGIPNFADGFGINPTSLDSYFSTGLYFTPVSIAIPDGVDVNNDSLFLLYDASDPSGVVRGGNSYSPRPGGFRLWTADGSLPRNVRPVGAGGSFVPDGTTPLSAFGLGDNDRRINLWLEALTPFTPIKGSAIKVAFYSSSGYEFASYAVPITVVNVDAYGDADVTADDPHGSFTASVSYGIGPDGKPLDVGNGTTIQWRVEGAGGSLDAPQTSTDGGLSLNTLHTSTVAGAVYRVYARLLSVWVDGGVPQPFTGPELLVATTTVHPGKASKILFRANGTEIPTNGAASPRLAADGTSTVKISVEIRDSVGNLVEDDTPVDWILEGKGVLSDADPMTRDGRASVTVRSGIYPGDIRLVARADGYQESVDISIIPVNVRLGITGNVLTLGTGETAVVTALVFDNDGRPVKDGTPITWYSQKGTIRGDSIVAGGVAHATLYAVGGSQIPGYGFVRAFVGSRGGDAGYLWVLPSTTPPTGQLVVQSKNLLLAGDLTTDALYPVDQADGSQIAYPVHAQTEVTITNGTPGATVLVSADAPNALGGDLLFVRGSGGLAGTTTTVTLDAQGRGKFSIESRGQLLPNLAIVVPVTVQEQGWIYNGPKTTLNVSVQPGRFIAGTLDFISNIGWGIVTGEGDSAEAIVGDMAFSMIPVVGVYTDIRDIGKELLKLWPGGESPNWKVFGFAVFGVAGSILGPQVDWFPTLGKKMAQVLDASKGVWGSVMEMAKKADISALNNVKDLLIRIVNNSLGGNFRLRNIAEEYLVKNPEDMARLSGLLDGLGDDAVEFLERVVSNPKLGEAVAKRVTEMLGRLKPSQLADIKAAGTLDQVAESIAQGMPRKRLKMYVEWLDAKKTNPRARIPGSLDKEHAIDELLLSQGYKIEPNLLENKWINNPKQTKQPDRIINGVLTEYKTLDPGATAATVKNNIGNSIRNEGQGRVLYIDSRKSGLTEDAAIQGLIKGWGYSRGKLDEIIVILEGNKFLRWPPAP